LSMSNPDKQFKDRPVPGFQALVEVPVGVDDLLEGGENMQEDG